MSSSIQGNAGVAAATVTLSGDAVATAVSDVTGTYTFSGLADGNYTVTPTKTSFTFTPASKDVVIAAADDLGVNFAASDGSTAVSVIDSRTAPNDTLDVQDTQFYVVEKHPSHLLPVDSRADGAPADSRKTPNIPENSRT